MKTLTGTKIAKLITDHVESCTNADLAKIYQLLEPDAKVSFNTQTNQFEVIDNNSLTQEIFNEQIDVIAANMANLAKKKYSAACAATDDSLRTKDSYFMAKAVFCSVTMRNLIPRHREQNRIAMNIDKCISS